MSEPLVSVVIAAYDRPEMLRLTIDSVLTQTWREVEVLVRDDSPTDSCQLVVAEFDDPRIRYTHNTPALGTMANHLAGFREARGTYLATLNDDDLYTPGYLEAMVTALEARPHASLAFANHAIIDEEGRVDAETTQRITETFGRAQLTPGLIVDAKRSALVDRSVPGMFAVVRRSTLDLDDFPPEVSSGYDFWLVYLAVRGGHPIWFDERPLTSYRAHAGSQTSSFSADPTQRQRSEEYNQFMDRRLLADPGIKPLHRMIRHRLASSLVSSGATSLQQGSTGQAVRHFVASLTTRPSLRGLVGLAACALGPRAGAALLRPGR